MALATTCPSCKTSFKVLSEQLKLRRGMVRCGICQQVFSGVEYLRYVSDTRASKAEEPSSDPQTVAADLHTAFFLPETRLEAPGTDSPQPQALRGGATRRRRPPRVEPPPPAGSPDWPGVPDNSLVWSQRSGGVGGAGTIGGAKAPDRFPGNGPDADDEWPSTMVWPRPPEQGAADVIEPDAPDPQPTHSPLRDPPAAPASRPVSPPAPLSDDPESDDLLDDGDDAVDFFGRSTNPAFDFDLPPRGTWIAAGALTVLLALQVMLGAREVIAARLPDTRAFLETISAPFGLEVGMPIRPDAVTIESFDLARAPEGPFRYRMNMLLRNRSGMDLRWPSIELTLTDSTGGILVRKALLPAVYLGGQDSVARGMPANSERAIRLQLEAGEIVPSGYSAVLFYH